MFLRWKSIQPFDAPERRANRAPLTRFVSAKITISVQHCDLHDLGPDFGHPVAGSTLTG